MAKEGQVGGKNTVDYPSHDPKITILITKNEGIRCNGYNAEGIGCHTLCRRGHKSRILIITALTILVL